MITVVIALFNGRSTVAATLNSVLAQTKLPVEVIVADNGSTDDSVDVVRLATLGAPVPIQIVDASSRKGQAHARNVGAAYASTDWLLFLDQDDCLSVRFIEELDDVLATAPTCDFITPAVDLILLNAPVVRSQREVGPGDPVTGSGVMGSGLAVRLSTFEQVGGFDESAPPAGEDAHLIRRMISSGATGCYADASVLHYRLRASIGAAYQQGVAYGRGRRFAAADGRRPRQALAHLKTAARAAAHGDGLKVAQHIGRFVGGLW